MPKLLVIVAFVVILVQHADAQCHQRRGTVRFLDVGEGDATIIESHEKHVLIDTGNVVTGHTVIQKLRSLSVTNLDRIIITHPHLDHMSGIFQILQSLPVTSIHDNDEPLSPDLPDIYRWYSEFVRNDARYTPVRTGQSIQIGNFTLKVLSSSDSVRSKDWNANSLVMLLTAGSFRALLMSDANHITEHRLLEGGANLSATLLRVGHHGASDATSERLLSAVSPQLSIVSVNKGNIRGYPSQSVLNRLEKTTKLYTTPQHGSITVHVCNDGSYVVHTEK